MENKNTYYLVGAIVVIIAIIGGAYYYSRSTATDPVDTQVGDINQSSGEIITARHQFKNGVHLIAGSVNLPTPCHLLMENVQVSKSLPEQVTLAFTATSSAEACIQVITPVRFRFDVTASEDAEFAATWNGAPVRLNLIPVGPNEDIEDFEVFIKG